MKVSKFSGPWIAFTTLILASIIIVSCQKSLTRSDASTGGLSATTISATATENSYCKSQDYCLWAGQTINAGSVTVANDASNLYITVKSTEGFQNVSDNIKIWVGNDLSTLPVNAQSVPVPGQFPFKYTATGNEYTITIPFADIDSYSGSKITCDKSSLYFYIHVDAIANGNGETAWGGCTAGTNTNRWYFYDTYTTACCGTPPPTDNCYSQTGFAKGGYVFTTDPKSNPEKLPSLNLTKNRWGWAINLTSTGLKTYPIYIGAGLNNISKGKLAGTLAVNWDGTTVTVTYTMNSGFTLTEVHVYAGDKKPTTIAPGQYGNIQNFDPAASTFTGSYGASDTDGDGIWIIAHAGVFGCY